MFDWGFFTELVGVLVLRTIQNFKKLFPWWLGLTTILSLYVLNWMPQDDVIVQQADISKLLGAQCFGSTMYIFITLYERFGKKFTDKG